MLPLRSCLACLELQRSKALLERAYCTRWPAVSTPKFCLQDLDLSVDVTPSRGSAFTPSKVLLMNRERKMNMLSPEGGQKLWHTDIETGKVVSEWGFEKDGVDAPMRVC